MVHERTQDVQTKKLSVPKILSLSENNLETLEFLHFASEQARKNRKGRRKGLGRASAYFDFANVEKICPATALVLCSIYDIYQMRGGDLQVFEYAKWHPHVKNTFSEIGFFKWLDFKGLPSSDDLSGELPIQAFESEAFHVPEKPVTYLQKLVLAFNSHRERDSETIIHEGASKRIASAILEAVENSVRHAYHPGVPKDIRRRWWMGGVSHPASGDLMVACYDCGISIPGSIAASDLDDVRGVRKYVREVLTRFLSKKAVTEDDNDLDHKRLEIALRYLASTSGVEGGGKGLAHIASTIDDVPDGDIEIFSRRAYFCATKKGSIRSTLLPSAMPGTLIIWRMKLDTSST